LHYKLFEKPIFEIVTGRHQKKNASTEENSSSESFYIYRFQFHVQMYKNGMSGYDLVYQRKLLSMWIKYSTI